VTSDEVVADLSLYRSVESEFEVAGKAEKQRQISVGLETRERQELT
jgi:hypothetical protein